MKKHAFLLISLVLSLAACNGQSSSTSAATTSSSNLSSEPIITSSSEEEVIPNQKVVDRLKELLKKQDLTPFYSKSLGTIYTHEFNVLEIEEEDGDKITNYFIYAGLGFFDYYYDLSKEAYDSLVDEKGDVNTFDALSKGTGGYRLSQEGRSNTLKRSNWDDAETNNLTIFQLLTIKMTEQDALIFNALGIPDEGSYEFGQSQYLSASINKELLFGSISTRSFRDIFSQVDLFNAPGNVEHIDKLYYSNCYDLLTKSDKEISDFIIINQISIEEPEDLEEEDIKLSFTYANEDLDDEEKEYIFPGEIKGTLTFNPETLVFSGFTYEMTNTVETQDVENGYVRFANSRFTCRGISRREPFGEVDDPEDPTVYEDVPEFLKDLNEQVIPPNIQI